MAKVTKRDNLLAIFAILSDLGNSELSDFVTSEIALLDKRAAAPKKPTKSQRDNAEIKDVIMLLLADVAAPVRATEIAAEMGLSVQKITALLRQLVDDGRVTRHQDKKVVTFTL